MAAETEPGLLRLLAPTAVGASASADPPPGIPPSPRPPEAECVAFPGDGSSGIRQKTARIADAVCSMLPLPPRSRCPQLRDFRTPRVRLYTDRFALGSDDNNFSTGLDLEPRNLNAGFLHLLRYTQ